MKQLEVLNLQKGFPGGKFGTFNYLVTKQQQQQNLQGPFHCTYFFIPESLPFVQSDCKPKFFEEFRDSSMSIRLIINSTESEY